MVNCVSPLDSDFFQLNDNDSGHSSEPRNLFPVVSIRQEPMPHLDETPKGVELSDVPHCEGLSNKGDQDLFCLYNLKSLEDIPPEPSDIPPEPSSNVNHCFNEEGEKPFTGDALRLILEDIANRRDLGNEDENCSHIFRSCLLSIIPKGKKETILYMALLIISYLIVLTLFFSTHFFWVSLISISFFSFAFFFKDRILRYISGLQQNR